MNLLDLPIFALGLPAFVVATEILLGVAKSAPDRSPADVNISSTRVLIPAHDEELGIARILERLLDQLPAGMTALVVADNCTDRTAEIVRGYGVEVIERYDHSKLGKGFALAFGRDHLRYDPPDFVIVLDADCEANSADYRALQAAAARHSAPVQARYLMKPNRSTPPMVQVSNFALAVKNDLRQRGLSRLRAPVILTGSGMAFPWNIFDSMPLATASIVEDLELGIHLARNGYGPRFEPGAIVWSEAGSASATLVQRSRWEGGFLAIAREHALPLVWNGIRTFRPSLVWLGLHLATPPLALLVMLTIVALAATAAIAILGGSLAPLIVMLAAAAALMVALVAAWLSIGREYLSPATLVRLPFYLFWKIPLYLRLTKREEKKWIRTERSK